MSASTAAADATRGMSTREFFEEVRAGRLVVQRCATCGALAVPPKAVCPSCEGLRWDRATLAGHGEVTSFTVIRVPPAQFAAQAPYVVAVARMAEGVSLLGRLTDAPIEDVRVGLAVRFAGSPGGTDPPVITFVPAH